MPRFRLRQLPTTDPVTGEPLVVTRLETLDGSLAIEGRFSLGWVGRLTPEQLEFVGVLLRSRNNLQRVATDLGVAYNTARSRLDEIVDAVGGRPDTAERPRQPSSAERSAVLARLASGDLTVDEAEAELRALR